MFGELLQRIEKRIRISAAFIGLHHWPEAPADVAYLRQLHRHVFKVEAEFVVDHDNRQLEFHQVQSQLRMCIRLLETQLEKNPSMSCEMMAATLGEMLASRIERWPTQVSVSEDGENTGFAIFHTVIRNEQQAY